jgi:hypothetical protein
MSWAGGLERLTIQKAVRKVPRNSQRQIRAGRQQLRLSARTSALFAAITLPLILLVKYGYGLHPQWFRFADAADQWPNVAGSSLLAVGDRALLSNSAPAWLAGALHLTSENAYLTLSGLLTLLAISGPLLLRMQNHESSFARLYFMVIAGGALAPVLLMWVGGYDALLVCGLTLGTLAKNRGISIFGWALASFTHSSVAIPAAILFAAFLVWNAQSLRSSPERSRGTSALLGVLAGYLIIHWLTDLWGGSTDRFTLFRLIPFNAILSSYLNSLPVLVLSGLGITWLFLLFKRVRALPASRRFYVLSTLTIAFIPLIAVDQTRIIALCLVPLTLAWIESLSSHLSVEAVTRIWRRMLIPAILVPIGVVWMGATYWPHWL